MRLYCWLVSDYHSVGWSACDCHSPTVAILPTDQKIVFQFNLTVIWFSACVFAGGLLSVTTKEHLRIPWRFLRKPQGCRSGFGSQPRSSLWVKRSCFSFSFSLAVSGTTLVPSCTVLDATLVGNPRVPPLKSLRHHCAFCHVCPYRSGSPEIVVGWQTKFYCVLWEGYDFSF